MAANLESDTPPPPLGDNSGAVRLAELLQDHVAGLTQSLVKNYAELARRAAALVVDAKALPEAVETDEQHGRSTDFYKDVDGVIKEIKKTREAEKAPFLEGGRKVDSFFNSISDTLEKVNSGIAARCTAFLRAKEDEARRKRLAEEQRLRDEAAEANRKAAEATRLADEARAREAAARKPENKTAAAAEARGHDETAEYLQSVAAQTSHAAEQAGRAAEAKPADLARTRGKSSLGTLRAEWTFSIEDYSKIPLETLRPYLERAAIEKALKGFVKVHKEHAVLEGVKFFEEKKGHFR